jgi:hypothetical protein
VCTKTSIWRRESGEISRHVLSTTWGFHGCEYEDDCLLGYSAVWSGRSLPAFQRYLLPPSSERWNVSKLLPDYTALQPRRQPYSITSCFKLLSISLEVSKKNHENHWSPNRNWNLRRSVQKSDWISQTCYSTNNKSPSQPQQTNNSLYRSEPSIYPRAIAAQGSAVAGI